MSEVERAEPATIRLGRNYGKLWTASVVSNLGDGVAVLAYPWLASAVTRNALLIAGIGVMQRLPWLLFTLPAGVITDRLDRRNIMLAMNLFRTVLTLLVAGVVAINRESLVSPDAIGSASFDTNWAVYLALLFSSLLFGMAEVLYDNSAQTIIPAMVAPEGLERANGRLWGAELVANSFLGPPLGSVLIGIGFVVPFLFDAGTFAVAAAVLFVITGSYRAPRDPGGGASSATWREEIRDGVTWLWRHPLLRSLAIILGLINGLGMVAAATLVLFAQEVLRVDATVFAVLTMAGAIGGVLGGFLAPRVSARLGSGGSLVTTIVVSSATSFMIGLATHWLLVFIAMAGLFFFAVVWNVITVSLRQAIIPDRLLGRVNSVYRLFGWGAVPVGMALGGLIVVGCEAAGIDRTWALRMPWLLSALAYVGVLIYGAPRLTTKRIESARTSGIAARRAESEGNTE